MRMRVCDAVAEGTVRFVDVTKGDSITGLGRDCEVDWSLVPQPIQIGIEGGGEVRIQADGERQIAFVGELTQLLGLGSRKVALLQTLIDPVVSVRLIEPEITDHSFVRVQSLHRGAALRPDVVSRCLLSRRATHGKHSQCAGR
jgi:hypothetical protein